VVAPPGAHEYVPPPVEGVAVKLAELPEQIAAGVLTVTVGTGFTVIKRDAVPTQPDKVYVTVYVVEDAGETVIAAVVAPPGDQE
jgi:hypothetical protein